MNPLIEARSLCKSYGTNQVLSDLSFSIGAGEVVSLIGENGAGKSTASKILAGIISPDSGELLVDGVRVSFNSPRDAITAGIGIVHQELCLADNLSIAENICLGREPTAFGMIDYPQMRKIASEALARLGLHLKPEQRVSSLSPAEQQLVEIARVLSVRAKLLIFDEPTSSLSESEASVLLDLIKRLQREGVSILYVSHRLPEVQEISERVIALRDGKNSGEMRGPTFSRDALIQMIVGRELKDIYGYSPRPAGDVVLEVIDLQPSTHHEPCSLTLRAGEVVGVAGLIGSGRSELLESIAGLRAPVQGAVTREGKSIPLTSAAAAGRAGIALVPESRKEQGIIAECSILENVNLSHLAVSTLVALRHTAEESEIARATIRDLQVRCSGEEQAVGKLSGGNQQKVVLGRCLAIKPRVLLLDEPTRGVDVGARREIYSLLFKLAEQGLAILFVSSELEEVLGIADRVLVMSEGAIRGEIPRERLSEHAIISLASPQERRAA